MSAAVNMAMNSIPPTWKRRGYAPEEIFSATNLTATIWREHRSYSDDDQIGAGWWNEPRGDGSSRDG